MNQKHLKLICTALDLGEAIRLVTNVPGSRGGSFMWHVITDRGSYAIKQLAPSIDLSNDHIVIKYELSEVIAEQFKKQGVPAVSAIEKSGKHLFIYEQVGYLIYPWVDGYVLGRNEVSEVHALMIAEVIAKLHTINLNVHDIAEPLVDIHTNDSIVSAIDKAMEFKCPFAKLLKEHQSLILEINDSYLAVTPLLLENTVVTHGDINQLNIIWDKENQPILIDWESAGQRNPTREIIRACLGWSGMGENDCARSIYINMLSTYLTNGGSLDVCQVNAALNSVAGGTINWLLFNINVACTSSAMKERDTANEEISTCIMTLSRHRKLIPNLINISQQVLASYYSDKLND